MLRLEQVNTFYGDAHILFDLSFEIEKAEFACILGRNGVGKTTTLRTIMGLTPPRSGRVLFNDEEISRLPSYKVANKGIGYIPENRIIFTNLTVERNLIVGQKPGRHNSWNLDSVYKHFPQLERYRQRSAENLSGGEQQMLATGRALMANPRVLLMDEPSMGLAPVLVDNIFETIRQLHAGGTTILLVEQNARMALQVAGRGYVLQSGAVVLADTAENLRTNEMVRQAYLGET